MSILGEFLQRISSATNFPIDQVNFVFCMLLCAPLGTIFRLLLHPNRVSPNTRRAVSLFWGTALTWFCFEWQTLILISFSSICYILTWLLNPASVHKYVLIVSMGFMSVAHLYRQITDYGGYTLDFTGPLMVLVQKITYVAFSVHDGLGRDDSKLTEEQRKCRLEKVPSLLEYFSYLFHYSTILVGPVCTFKDFSDFINGSDIISKESGQKEPSPLFAALRNLMTSMTCIAFVILTGSNYPIARNGDPNFISSNPLLWRLAYAWISIVSVRMRYYFAFKLAEAMNNFCGLGFNGFDENGRAKWNRMTIVNILKIEFATSLKEVLDNWNICTVLWLRRIVYERVSHHPTLAVFVLSAVWHGFYPGYYMAFATCGLMVEAARKVRRKYRPLFQGSHVSSRLYDLVTCAVTILSLTFASIPFVGLEARFGLEFWRSMYFYGIVWSIMAFLLLSCGKSKTEGKKDNKTENVDVRDEEKDKKGNSTDENLTELRNRVKKNMESSNELFRKGTPNSLLKENLIVGS